ncbi:riboflavin kinase [uncultured Lawsonella sp.]|uniref:riboflavin kinase n=2 Tax=Mycobacteriales TaxID=85007 RepID=UPI002630E05B|nr:riboflavin kinase [uncultured Lawsonella sp.]
MQIEGIVQPGDQRGRLLGFPTANIALPTENEQLWEERSGVWSGLATLDDGTCHLATISIGRRPTFYRKDGELLAEAFLHDFQGDLYGRKLVINLEHFLRTQAKFDSVDELISAMEADAQNTEKLVTLQP